MIARNDNSSRLESGIQVRPAGAETASNAGRYEIFQTEESVKVRTANSTLYDGADIQLDQEVTIEALNVSVADDVQIRNELRDKAEFLMPLSHQNVLRARDCVTSQGWIVYDPIKAVLTQTNKSPKDAREVLLAALSAIQALHESDRLHGELSDNCLVLGDDDKIKLVCSAGYALDDTDAMTSKEDCLAAPEMVDPDLGPITWASDLYCLGLMVMLVCQPREMARLFKGDQRKWAVSAEPIPEKLLKAYSEEVREVLKKLVAKNPKDRFASAHEALAAIQARESSSARPTVRTTQGIGLENSPSAKVKTVVDLPNLFDLFVDPTWLAKQLKRPVVYGPLLVIVGLSVLANRERLPMPVSSTESDVTSENLRGSGFSGCRYYIW
ncbi:MAG: hypothetical protein R3C28_28560 [Pirellulaceae bacterium]